jgi:hypothetical protein
MVPEERLDDLEDLIVPEDLLEEDLEDLIVPEERLEDLDDLIVPEDLFEEDLRVVALLLVLGFEDLTLVEDLPLVAEDLLFPSVLLP